MADEFAPTPEQFEAISSDVPTLLVEAGAGSGKTEVLVRRYCRLAEEGGIGGIGGIVAFTFTERAAAEMRERARKRLARLRDEAVAAGDEDKIELFTHLYRRVNSAWISTIHGFCQRLISMYSTRCDLDPKFRVLDEDAAGRLREEAFALAADEFMSGPSDPAREELAATGLAEVRSIVEKTFEKLSSQGLEARLPEAKDIPPEEVDAGIADFMSLALAAKEEAEAAFVEHPKWSDKPGMLGRIVAATQLTAEDFRKLPPSRMRKFHISRTGSAFRGPQCTAFQQAVGELEVLLVTARSGVAAWNAIGELLELYAARYTALKKVRSALDFGDLERTALKLLRESEFVRNRLHERVRHVMVDEFQDTNRMQMQLVETVRGEDTSLFCVGDELQSIYGFRHADVEVFRELKAAIGQMPPAEGKVLKLRGNFRSHPDVLGSVNHFGGAMFPEYTALTRGRSADSIEPAGERVDGPRVEIIAMANKGEDKAKWNAETVQPDNEEGKSLAALAEIRVLVRRLRELVDAGVPRGSIVVLVRAGTHARRLRDELEFAGLDPYLVAGRGYFDQQQVDDVRRILSLIANPTDDESLVAVGISPAGLLAPDDLYAIANARADNQEPLWISARRLVDEGAASPAVDRFVAILEGLRREAPGLALDAMVERAVEAFGFDLATLAMPGGQARWANVRKLMDLAASYEELEGRDLRGFLDHVHASAAGASKHGEAVTEAEGQDRVRIMTIHSAKGLEFDVVAVPFMGAGLSPKQGGDSLLLGKPGADNSPPVEFGLRLSRSADNTISVFMHDELKAAGKEAVSLEERRLAHVGFTRAKKHLIVSGSFPPDKLDDEAVDGTSVMRRILSRGFEAGEFAVPPAEPALDSLEEAGEVPIRSVVVAPGEEMVMPVPGEAPDRSGEGETAVSGGVSGPRALARPAGTPKPAILRKLSYASMSAYEQCPYCFYREYVLGLDAAAAPGSPLAADDPGAGVVRREQDEGRFSSAEPAPTGASASASERAGRYGPGNAVHALLEWSALNGWDRPDASRIADALAVEGLAGDTGVAERVEAMIGAWFASDVFARIKGLPCRPEVPFLLAADPDAAGGEVDAGRPPRYEGSLVRGMIDLMVEMPDGRRLVVDYKTDRLGGDSTPESLMEGKYGLQRQIYSVAASTADAPASTAYVFLGGDTAEPPPAVEADATPDFLAEAKSLIASLAGHIAEADFTPGPACPACHPIP